VIICRVELYIGLTDRAASFVLQYAPPWRGRGLRSGKNGADA
jgi:hypothetical protein